MNRSKDIWGEDAAVFRWDVFLKSDLTYDTHCIKSGPNDGSPYLKAHVVSPEFGVTNCHSWVAHALASDFGSPS